MQKIIYEGNDKLYNPDEFCRIVLAIPESEAVLRNADKDLIEYYRYNILCLGGVTILHRSIIGEYNAEHVKHIQVSLQGEESFVLYVEKKIKDALEKARMSKEKKAGPLEQLVS